MTRFEEYFPPDIVRAVYDRIEREEQHAAERRSDGGENNVISLLAYRQRLIAEGPKVVF